MRSSSYPSVRECAAAALLTVAGAAVAGCVYGFQGGGGLPAHIETVYVAPVENETTRFALTDQLTQGLLDAVTGRLGAQLASEGDADAVIRARLTRYSDQAMNFQAREGQAAEVFQRRISISANVSIVDLTGEEERPIWSSSSVSGSGEYAPDQETEGVGVELALENLIQEIVNGAQSQW